jgi:hypothetical protein
MVDMQEEHVQIQAKRKDGEYLTWAEVNNMPHTTKVSSTLIVIGFNYSFFVDISQVLNSLIGLSFLFR